MASAFFSLWGPDIYPLDFSSFLQFVFSTLNPLFFFKHNHLMSICQTLRSCCEASGLLVLRSISHKFILQNAFLFSYKRLASWYYWKPPADISVWQGARGRKFHRSTALTPDCVWNTIQDGLDWMAWLFSFYYHLSVFICSKIDWPIICNNICNLI